MTLSGTFSRSAVAAPHHLAGEAGRAVLADGGNAIEAMVAMAATVAVVYPHMNAIGGDGFWLIQEPGGRLRGIEACGQAGSLATIERYRQMDYETIPFRGPHGAVTVAGAIGGWETALALSASRGGRMPLKRLLADAISHAAKGFPLSRSQARTRPQDWATLKRQPGFAESFLVDGEYPPAGTLSRAPRLADTLDHLAGAGLDDFYRGDVAREIAGDLERIGAPITRDDLARFRTALREPLSVRIQGALLANLPPPTQGLASLLTLAIFARLGTKRAGTPEHIHALVEACKRAYRTRDLVCTDFDRLTHDPAAFLSDRHLAREAAQISLSRAAPFPLPPDKGDTIWMGAMGEDGLAVSYIQSIFWEYGCGCVLERTGVLWQNRGASFSLDRHARNPLQPGRRPFHTLNPALAILEDGRIIAYGAMGGDGQPQFQAQIFSRYALFGEPLPDALDAPRFLLGRTWGDETTTLKLENRFDPSLITALERAGHVVEVIDEPYGDQFGHAGMLVRHDRSGVIEAGHDPRADGGAAGI
jgi:oxamate amidohydrolase